LEVREEVESLVNDLQQLKVVKQKMETSEFIDQPDEADREQIAVLALLILPRPAAVIGGITALVDQKNFVDRMPDLREYFR